MATAPKRIGIVGYGHLGKFLTEAILQRSDLELAFIWNRTKSVFEGHGLDSDLILEDLADCHLKKPDLIVEVSHPIVVKQVCISAVCLQAAVCLHVFNYSMDSFSSRHVTSC